MYQSSTNGVCINGFAVSMGCADLSIVSGGAVGGQYVFVTAPDQINVFKMVPIAMQVSALVQAGQFESALDTASLLMNSPVFHAQLSNEYDLSIADIHEQFALSLHQKVILPDSASSDHYMHTTNRLNHYIVAPHRYPYQGDFEGAVSNYISARTKPAEVISLFPDFIPASLHTAYSSLSRDMALPVRAGSSVKLTGMILHRAASALVIFCEYHRTRLRNLIDRMEVAASKPSSMQSKNTGNFGSRDSIAAGDCLYDDGPDENYRHSSVGNPFDADDDDIAGNSFVDSASGAAGKKRPDLFTMSLAEAQAVAVLVDTAYLAALIYCSPPRRSTVMEVLTALPPVSSHGSLCGAPVGLNPRVSGSIGFGSSFGNQCHVDSCAVILASQGSAFIEPLLWLYRSHSEHKKALFYLTEEKCVIAASGVAAGGNGGKSTGATPTPTVSWTKPQFYQWTAEYLRWLWFSDDSPAVGPGTSQGSQVCSLVLSSLRPVLEYDADLGLSVLTTRPKSMRKKNANSGAPLNFGGRGVAVTEVITFLESVNPGPSRSTKAFLADLSSSSSNRESGAADELALSSLEKNSFIPSGAAAAGSSSNGPLVSSSPNLPVPLVNGRALGVAYLEWLVYSGGAPNNLHDEYAQLLIEGIPLQVDLDHSLNDLQVRLGDNEVTQLYKVYRRKLQYYLRHQDADYHPERIIKSLPPRFSHEYALLLSKLGRHEEVLKIYSLQLRDLAAAEDYCNQIFLRAQAKDVEKAPDNSTVVGAERTSSGSSIANGNVYLILIRILVSVGPSSPSSSSPSPPKATGANVLGVDGAGAQTHTQSSAQLIAAAIAIAERNFEKIDPLALIDIMPKNVTLADLSGYISLVLEFGYAKKRNLQVLHQLFRMREVNIRTMNQN